MFADCVIHLIDRAAVRDLELLIALILAGVTADTDIYAGGNLGGGDADDIIAETRPFAGRDSDGRERHEDAVGADDLQQLRLVYVLRIDLIVIDDRAQARTRECDLCVRILALDRKSVV